ncbi:unnamed protein product [Paramecium sonneborni]|uniref:Uncharacterized protein n=1 Tax=Paramecium sonneborni TaxID=65129 RepID=A0A8S1QLT2_9CILI|nr:unnamed protein product [Paramecium sonneborni]
MIKLSAKGSNPEEDQMDKLEQILIQLKVPYKINNEIRTFALDDSHYKQSQDKIQELFFKPHKDGESLLQILLSED